MNKGQIKHSRNRFRLKKGVSKINRDPNEKKREKLKKKPRMKL